ncbi:hypothetical protein D3C73_1012020 [compost metagenome]
MWPAGPVYGIRMSPLGSARCRNRSTSLPWPPTSSMESARWLWRLPANRVVNVASRTTPSGSMRALMMPVDAAAFASAGIGADIAEGLFKRSRTTGSTVRPLRWMLWASSKSSLGLTVSLSAKIKSSPTARAP